MFTFGKMILSQSLLMIAASACTELQIGVTVSAQEHVNWCVSNWDAALLKHWMQDHKVVYSSAAVQSSVIANLLQFTAKQKQIFCLQHVFLQRINCRTSLAPRMNTGLLSTRPLCVDGLTAPVPSALVSSGVTSYGSEIPYDKIFSGLRRSVITGSNISCGTNSCEFSTSICSSTGATRDSYSNMPREIAQPVYTCQDRYLWYTSSHKDMTPEQAKAKIFSECGGHWDANLKAYGNACPVCDPAYTTTTSTAAPTRTEACANNHDMCTSEFGTESCSTLFWYWVNSKGQRPEVASSLVYDTCGFAAQCLSCNNGYIRPCTGLECRDGQGRCVPRGSGKCRRLDVGTELDSAVDDVPIDVSPTFV